MDFWTLVLAFVVGLSIFKLLWRDEEPPPKTREQEYYESLSSDERAAYDEAVRAHEREGR